MKTRFSKKVLPLLLFVVLCCDGRRAVVQEESEQNRSHEASVLVNSSVVDSDRTSGAAILADTLSQKEAHPDHPVFSADDIHDNIV